MEQKEIIENNKLIANFIGDKWNPEDVPLDSLYYSDWNLLMKVVTKITKENMVAINFNLNGCLMEILDFHRKPILVVYEKLNTDNTVKNAIYSMVVKYINWRNKQ